MPTRDLTIDIKSKFDTKGTTAAQQGLKQTEDQSKRFERALSTQEAQAKRSAAQLDAVGSSALRTRRLLENATKRLPRIEVEADTSQPERQLADLTARLRELSGMRIGIDIDPRQVEQQVGEIRRELMTLADDHPEVVVGANVERAIAGLEAVEREARKVDGRVAKIKVDVDGGPAAVASMALIDGALSMLEAAGPAKVAVIGAAILTLPATASAAGGAIVVGLGGALAGLGLAASHGSEAAQAALTHLGEAAKAEAARVGEPFEKVWVTIVQVAERELEALSPTVRGALEDLAPDVQDFVDNAGASLGELAPAIAGVERAFSAVLQQLGPAMPEVMQHFAAAVTEITGAVEKNPQVIERMVVGISVLAEWAGTLIGKLIKLADWLHNNAWALEVFAGIISPAAGVLATFGIEAFKASQQAGGLEKAATGAARQTSALGDASTVAAQKMAESWSKAFTQFGALTGALEASKSQGGGQDRQAAAAERLAEVQRTSAEKIKRAQQELGDAQEQAADRTEQAQRRVADAHERAAEQVAQAQDRIRQARESLAAAVEDAAQREAAAEQRVEDARRRTAEVAADSAEQIESAAQRVGDAQRRTAEVAEDSARQIEAAAQRVSDAQVEAAQRELDAEARLRDSHARTAQAVEDLTDAREQAAQRLEDLAQSQASSALDEEGAQIAIERAKQRLDEVNADPQSTGLDRQEADLAFRRAVQRLEEIRQRNADLQQEIDDANRAGIEGSAEVVAAKERIAAAQQAEQEAEAALAKARADGAKVVAAAEQALADARRDAARQQEEAQRTLAEAESELNKARIDAARQQEDAQRALAEAEAEVNQARIDGSKDVLQAKKDVIDAEKEAVKTAKDAKRDIADAEKEAAKATQDAARDIADAEEAVRQARQDAARDTLKANQDVKDSWGGLAGAAAVTTEQLLKELEKQVKAQEDWAANLVSLAGRVPDEMLDELAALGPGGAKVVALASQMSDVELKKFIALHGRSGKEAGDTFAGNLAEAGPALRDIARRNGVDVADKVREGMDGGRLSVFESARRLGVEIDKGIGGDRTITLTVNTVHTENAPPRTSREAGAVDRYAAGGLRPVAPMIATRPTVLFGEGRDDEAFIPYDSAFRPRAESLLSQVAGDFGGVFLKPAGAPAGGGDGGSALVAGGGGNTYHITVQVPPNANMAQVGAVTVDAIQEYERRSGAGWRR